MASYGFPAVETFHVTRNKKAQAAKVLEEAAEFFAACQTYMAIGAVDAFDAMVDELCDLETAMPNCAELFGVTRADMERGMDRCEARNRERGRYTDELR